MMARPGATRRMPLLLLMFCHRRFKAYSKKVRSGPGKNGKLIGLEVLDATERYSLADVFNISTNNLILEKRLIKKMNQKM